MSYCSRLYRQRNSHTYDESSKQPFFSKQNDTNNNSKGSFFQAKLSVNKPGDSFEKEADSVANTVLNHSNQKPQIQQNRINSVQKQTADPEKKKLNEIQKMNGNAEDEKKKSKKPLQRKPEVNTTTASPQISSKIEQTAGKGNALPKSTQLEMSSAFGVDFSNVKVHHDNESGRMNKVLGAQAFTHGNDIYFNEGKYDTNSSTGKFLLAHELTHVVQQQMAEDLTIQKSPAVAAAIGAALVAAVLCAYAFYEYALDNYTDKSDKWKHCWVSCKIASYCGGDAFALIIGAGKEGLDAICDAYGKGCKAEFLDFLADVVGVGCANVPFLPCVTCCDNSTDNL